MGKNRFKIVELEDVQVLFTRERDEDGDPVIKATFFENNLKFDMTVAYEEVETRDLEFEECDEVRSTKVVAAVRQMYTEGGSNG
jgi:hypothetical protein